VTRIPPVDAPGLLVIQPSVSISRNHVGTASKGQNILIKNHVFQNILRCPASNSRSASVCYFRARDLMSGPRQGPLRDGAVRSLFPESHGMSEVPSLSLSPRPRLLAPGAFGPRRQNDSGRPSFIPNGGAQPPRDAPHPRRLLFGADESATAQPVTGSAKMLLTKQPDGRPRMIDFSFAQTRTQLIAEENGGDFYNDAPSQEDGRPAASPRRIRRSPRNTFDDDDPD
jgi:hypothetical protein